MSSSNQNELHKKEENHRKEWEEVYGVKSNFMKISTVVVDRVMKYLTPHAFKVLVFVIRKTDGWGKCTDYIAVSQFCSETGLSERRVYSALNELTTTNIIFRVKSQQYLRVGLSRVGDKPFTGECIDWPKLKQMKRDRDEANRRRTKRARSQNPKHQVKDAVVLPKFGKN